MTVVTVRGISYEINQRLKEKWDNIKDGGLGRKDEDRCYITDGRERVGKSLLTIQQAAYIDPTILDNGINGELLPRICFTADEFLKAIKETDSKPGETKCIIFDEAFRGLSSRAAVSKVNKTIIQALMEMGQKNLVVYIVSPVFFMLDLYVAMLRSEALIHVYKNKTGRRVYKVYNYKKKAKLYKNGVKQGWEYKVKTKINGTFSGKYPGGDDFEARYRLKKRLSIEKMGVADDKKEKESKFMIQRDILIQYLYEKNIFSQRDIENIFKAKDIHLTQQAIGLICKKNYDTYLKLQVKARQHI